MIEFKPGLIGVLDFGTYCDGFVGELHSKIFQLCIDGMVVHAVISNRLILWDAVPNFTHIYTITNEINVLTNSKHFRL